MQSPRDADREKLTPKLVFAFHTPHTRATNELEILFVRKQMLAVAQSTR